MQTFEEMQKSWTLNAKQDRANCAVSNEGVRQMITLSVKRQRNRIFSYFWASYLWQFMIYASLCHLMIRYWGDGTMVMISLVGIVLYLPFTTTLIENYSRMASQKSSSSAESVYANLQKQYVLLSDFFRFKKKFDWVGVPLTCCIITAIVFKLWVPDGLTDHLTGALITYVCALIAFLTATVYENRRSFKRPLEGLQQVMNELQQDR